MRGIGKAKGYVHQRLSQSEYENSFPTSGGVSNVLGVLHGLIQAAASSNNSRLGITSNHSRALCFRQKAPMSTTARWKHYCLLGIVGTQK